jgi:hypothetical protein
MITNNHHQSAESINLEAWQIHFEHLSSDFKLACSVDGNAVAIKAINKEINEYVLKHPFIQMAML